MKHTLTRTSVAVLLLTAAAWGAATAGRAQDRTYVKTPGYDEVQAAVRRLDRDGDKLPTKVRDSLRAEGRAIIDLEQRYYDGKMPDQLNVKAAEQKWNELKREDAALLKEIEAYNAQPVRTQEQRDRLLNKQQDLGRRWKAHDDYCADLNARIDADNAQLEARYRRFVRAADTAFRTDGTKPDLRTFIATWKSYNASREVAKGLAPERNRCAMVVSLTLGLAPREKEDGLEKLEGWTGKMKSLVEQQVTKFWQQQDVSLSDMAVSIPEVTKGGIARRVYIRADQLATRLEDDWGKPLVLKGEDLKKAHELLKRKKGVIYFPDGYGTNGGARHIDLWNGVQLASGITAPFEKASEVRVWIIPD